MILKCISKCIINNFKPPQNFEFLESELSCRFIWFEKFHGFVSLAHLEDVTDCLSSVLLFINYYCFTFYSRQQ